MDIRRRMLFKKKASSSEGGSTEGSYTVNLNGQWEATTAVPNPDSTLYDGVYRSSSNYNVNSGVATMYITIKDCSSFKMYIRSYAESCCDYVMVSQLDKTITGSTSYRDTILVKAHTKSNSQSGTALSSYTLVEFTGITSGEHTITVVYRKDGSVNNGDDRGYVLISKSNGSSGDEEGGGDIEIDTTYAIYYTSVDGNIVTPNKTDVFGANIVSNNYVDGQGIISFDGPVKNIGDHAFFACDSLTSITIPDSVTTIGDSTFAYCDSLTSVTIGDSVTTIGYYAFQSCTNLTSVTIGDSATTIGSGAFRYCSSLTSITIPDSVTTIGDSAFDSCSSLTSITIPDSVTTIGYYAFQSCTNLTSVTIGDSATTIGSGAFRYCSSLTSITIPDSVTTIGDAAFYYCDSLTSVTIGDSVTTIGEYAFQSCTNLTSVYCKATTPPALGGTYVFDYNGSGRKIYVPAGSVEAYNSATNWSNYADAIVGYNF